MEWEPGGGAGLGEMLMMVWDVMGVRGPGDTWGEVSRRPQDLQNWK